MIWLDLHIDTLWRMRLTGADPLVEAAGPERAGTSPGPGLQVTAEDAARAGLRAAIYAIYVESEHEGSTGLAELLLRLGLGLRLAARSGGRLRIVHDAAELERCLGGEAQGLILGLEGAHPLMGSIELLVALHGLGLRVLGLTWNQANPFASGCALEGEGDGGLTPLGRRLVAEARRLGITLDLAHASPRTLDDALATGPLLVSHTACRALRDHRRNLSDEQLRRVAAAGGVVGITFCPAFLSAEGAHVTSARVADHLVHAASVAGCEAIALGTDFDGIDSTPEDLPNVRALPQLTEELNRRGFTPMEIEGIAWRNAARFLRAGLGPAGA